MRKLFLLKKCSMVKSSILLEFVDTVSDYMIEWNDINIVHCFMESTFRFETEEELNDETLFRLRIDRGVLSTLDYLKEDLEKRAVSKLINKCYHSLLSRIKKSYEIDVLNESYWDPFNHSGWNDKRWRDVECEDGSKDYDCLVRSIRFKLLSKKDI